MFNVRNGDTHAADQPSSTASRSGRGVAAIAAVLLIAACTSSGGADRDPGGSGAGASPSPSAEASAPVEVRQASPSASASPSAFVVRPDDGVLPRSLTYGILNWTVTDAVITNQDPKTYVAGEDGEPTAKTSLIVDLDIRNDNTHVSFVTTTSRLVLELPDGTVVEGKDLERPSARPVSSVEGRYTFEVPDDTSFEGLVLRFEDPDREPSLDLALSGSAGEVEANKVTEPDLAIDVPLPGIDMRWTVQTIMTGNDWPLPVGFKGGTRVAGARAEDGQRFVGIVARVDVGQCNCKGGVLSQAGSVRLLVDGLPFTTSAAESSTPIMTTSTFSDVMLVFDIPAEASETVLQIGPLEKADQQATVDLDLN